MSYSEPARIPGRPTRSTILAPALVVVSATLIGVLGYPALASSASSAPSSSTAGSPQPAALRVHDSPPRDPPGAPGEPELGVPDDTTVFQNATPAVANLDPDVLRALRRAATDAAGDGVEFDVNSGWRSPAHQQRLFDEAVAKYGSKAEAARWVAIPGTSAHESGDAVDLGPAAATAWLSGHGAAYGLCQIYSSEPWHYELRPDAVDHGCPPMYADPSQDPRMQR